MAVLIKKNAGNAVERNYRKRIVREYLRKKFYQTNPYNDVIFLFNYQGDISYHELETEFSKRLTEK